MLRIVTRSLLALLVVYLVGRLLLGNNGLIHQYKLQRRNELLTHSIDSLELVLQHQTEEHRRLLNDTLYIEEIARTHFGMSRPGEKVFQFIQPQDSLKKDNTQPPTTDAVSK